LEIVICGVAIEGKWLVVVLGVVDGGSDGLRLGVLEGILLGLSEGTNGNVDGIELGSDEGISLGFVLGWSDGELDGKKVGLTVLGEEVEFGYRDTTFCAMPSSSAESPSLCCTKVGSGFSPIKACS
jgi:hypothetical protein